MRPDEPREECMPLTRGPADGNEEELCRGPQPHGALKSSRHPCRLEAKRRKLIGPLAEAVQVREALDKHLQSRVRLRYEDLKGERRREIWGEGGRRGEIWEITRLRNEDLKDGARRDADRLEHA